jgi:hypothetical protein
MIPVARAQQPDFQIFYKCFWSYFPPDQGTLVFPDATALLFFRHARFTMLFSQSAPTDHSRCRRIICGGSICWSVRPEIRRHWLGHWPSFAPVFKQEAGVVKISASRFAIVLQAIGPPNGLRREFLRAHYAAPGHAATVTVLAEQAGYRRSGIYLWYEGLAKQIGAFVGERNPGVSLLVELVRPPTGTNQEWTLVMRPEFAVGLKRAGWIED